MHIEYNGVHLELLQLDRVERENVYSSDGQDLMYVKWVIGATCVYSPGGFPVGTAVTNVHAPALAELTSARGQTTLLGGPPAYPPVQQTQNEAYRFEQNSHTAVVTDTELRTRLFAPRGKLRLWVWDTNGQKQTWMESPKPGLTCDLAGGPKPLSVDIVRSQGEGLSFGVHFQIATYLSPCPHGSDQLVLSHRWEMEHGHDENQYLTRTIRGEVVFNKALLQANSFNPDWLRAQFLHPIPLGMKRKLPTVTASSDGTTIRYECVDVDTTITFDAGDSGATEIEIVEHVAYTQPWDLDPQRSAPGGKALSILGPLGGIQAGLRRLF